MHAAVLGLWILALPVVAQDGDVAPASAASTSPAPELGEAPPPARTAAPSPPAGASPPQPVVRPSLAEPPVPVAAPLPSVPPPREAPADPTRRRHLGGFAHLDIGGGWISTSAGSSAGGFSGGAVPLSVAGGASVVENWILGAELWALAAPTSRSGASSTLFISGIGPTVTHYFMPVNVFVTLTPALAVLSVTDNTLGVSDRTEYGFGLRLAVGKEWWVGDHWAAGVALMGFFSTNRDQGSGSRPTWTTFGWGVGLSATLN